MSPRDPNDRRLTDQSELSDEDHVFVEKLGEHFDLEPMSASARARFTEELDVRVERARHRRAPWGVWAVWAGAAASALAAAAVLALVYWQGTPETVPEPGERIATVPTPSVQVEDGAAPAETGSLADSQSDSQIVQIDSQTGPGTDSQADAGTDSGTDWESEILFGSASGEFLAIDEEGEENDEFDDQLPSDYAAIGSFFLDG